MKISYSWLKNYFESNVNPEAIATILTDCGLEVESFEKIQTIKGGLEGLVVGEVVEKNQHPNADKLSLTKVNIGQSELLSIVCGAPNVAAGQKVVVATIGTTLYSGDDSFKIKKSKIRGELSEGMLCAEDEIGVGTSHDGIMVLDSSVAVGTLAKDFFKVQDDYLYEIGLTPNRADATGHIGVARDIVAVLNSKNKNENQLIKPSVNSFKVDNNDFIINIEIEDTNLCPRYTGVTLSGVEVKESPDWLKNRLLSIGLTPINNIVDVTNFVLHETGQPLHAFDADKIKGNKVIVKTLPEKTSFITLDEKNRELSQDDLMICNEKEPMCIAGVFGGVKSGVTKSTTNIFLESAYFNPVSIRKTAKRHGLNTDASFRYERGADPNIALYALKRAVLLMQEVAGGVVSSEIKDIYPQPISDFIVDFNFQRCQNLIGENINPETIKNIITGLEIKILEENNEGLKLSVPPFKVDVQREVDVIEEVLRIYGYNSIQTPTLMKSALVYRDKINKDEALNSLSDLLVGNGYYEILSNSLTSSSYYANKDSLVEILNPLSKDLDVLRSSMLYSGLETISYNQNRKTTDLRLFEFGKTYSKNDSVFEETNFLSIYISGSFVGENWMGKEIKSNFFHLKGLVDLIVDRFGLNKLKLIQNEIKNEFSYGVCYQVNGKDFVHFGKIGSTLQSKFNISSDVFYANINIDVLFELLPYTKNITYKEVSKYPSVRRDLALVLDKSTSYSEIERIALKQERKLLKKLDLFDVYEGDKVEQGKKSYAVSFIFQDEDKTLNDAQIEGMMNKLIKSFEKELGAKIRG